MSRFFQNTKAVLIDLSGTLHIDNFVISGSQTSLKRLKSNGLKVKFVTNTSKESLDALHTRLKNLNFEIEKDEIFSSLTASKQMILKSGLRPHLMLTESAKQDFVDVNTCNPDAVLVGLSPDHFKYDELTFALRLLLDGGKLIAINKARYYKRPDGLALGAGAFVSALEYASGVKSVVVGKPEEQFFVGAANSLGCTPSECVMIGDDVCDDIIGATNAGMKGILVQTGKYRPGDEDKLSADHCILAKDFSEAVKILLSR